MQDSVLKLNCNYFEIIADCRMLSTPTSEGIRNILKQCKAKYFFSPPLYYLLYMHSTTPYLNMKIPTSFMLKKVFLTVYSLFLSMILNHASRHFQLHWIPRHTSSYLVTIVVSIIIHQFASMLCCLAKSLFLNY